MAGIDGGIWDDVIALIRAEIPEVEYRTWFSSVSLVGIEEGAFILAVPTSFARDWIRSRYQSQIEVALKSLGVNEPHIGFEVVPGSAVEQQDIFAASSETSTLAATPRAARGPQLNPKYVFANFIVGQNNNFAHAAALAVAEAPGRAYNPLFLYGDVGLGKTHLMHAVGHAVADRYPELAIEYVTTEAFTNDLITAIREDRMVQFRERYRSIDVLLIDDIQFIAGKERTQEEFFHTFNALYESGKQLILSSDRPPRDIPTLESRLRSRFEWGLISDIQAPELETRMAILAMNAEYRGVKVPPDVIDYIARHVTSNIRELEGALVRAIVYSSMSEQPLNRQTVAKALSDVFAPSDLELTMPDILQRTSDYFRVDPEDVKGKSRRQELVVPRQIAMYLIRELTTHSYPEIGTFFSGRDHSTVMYAVNKIQGQLDQGTGSADQVKAIHSSLI